MTMTAPAGPVRTMPPQRAPGATILVADGQAAVADVVAAALEGAGHRVRRAATGPDALAQVAWDPPDMAVIDVALPGIGGLEVLTDLRRTSAVPVILVSATSDVAQRVAGLELGADDYLTKPFSPLELTARVRSVLRRVAPPAVDEERCFDGLRIDLRAREAEVAGRTVVLTTKEFDLLAFLATFPRQVFTREQLLRQVWASTSDWQDPATVTEHVRRVRLKLGPSPSRWIATVRGVGYRFEG